MKLLDWLFRINRDNAPLVSEQAKSAEAHPITCFFRVMPVAHGMRGLRLDYVMIDTNPELQKSINIYWRNTVQSVYGEPWAKTIAPSQAYDDGFKNVTLKELRYMLGRYSNVCEYSATTGKPVL
tara:strand:- start:174 stop:545 length:372 start_codon:yes stop_codon:yes gene_type:complete